MSRAYSKLSVGPRKLEGSLPFAFMSRAPGPRSTALTMKSTTYSAFEAAKHFPSLDGMRAICVLMVMFSHIPAGVPRPGWMYGYLGVDVFFVLSGFLITTLLIRERAQNGHISLRAFYTRRFFRIVPVYLFTVLLYFAAVLAMRDPIRTAQFKVALPWLLGFMQEYRPAAAGNILGHAWTLGIEEKFYLLWPLLLMAIKPAHSRALVVWLVSLCVAVSLLPDTYTRSYGGLLIGAILAIVLAAPGYRSLLKKLPTCPDALLIVLVLVAYTLAGHNDRLILLFSGAIALLIASLVLRGGLLRKLFEAPGLVYIGKRSYAMYLIHVLVADSIGHLTPKIVPPNWFTVVILSYLASLAGASLMYVLIERPCINFGRRLSERFMERERVQLAVEAA
jgi:peptidoglycan/LPS O-acetylase OafA/YrhL